MIHLGVRLGLYRALAGQGTLSAADLADRTGLQERWLLEWVRGQAAAGLLDTVDGDRFTLSPEGAAVLADETGSLWFAAGASKAEWLPRRQWSAWRRPFVPDEGSAMTTWAHQQPTVSSA
jgi:hypothetical protein